MKYYVVKIINGKNYLDELVELATLNFESIGQHYFDLEEARVDQLLGERAFSGGDVPLEVIEEIEAKSEDSPIEIYFSHKTNADLFCKETKEKFNQLEIHQFERKEDDWNALWRKHYQKIEVEDILTIYPQWEDRGLGVKEIKIYPGQGFGTGEHETTWLCINHLGALLQQGFIPVSCFDFGCGSGILGIAATKLSDCKTDYCDIDKEALNNCVQNIDLNFSNRDFSGTQVVLRERFRLEKQYDLVFANILLNILIKEKPLLVDLVRPGGKLIISGILKGQKEELTNAFADAFKVEYESGRKDWWAITLEKL